MPGERLKYRYEIGEIIRPRGAENAPPAKIKGRGLSDAGDLTYIVELADGQRHEALEDEVIYFPHPALYEQAKVKHQAKLALQRC